MKIAFFKTPEFYFHPIVFSKQNFNFPETMMSMYISSISPTLQTK